MKKLFFPLLLSLVILTGCANTNGELPDTTESVETIPAGCYIPDSAVEQDTNGAVRQYELTHTAYSCIDGMDDRLLLISDSTVSELKVLSGDTGIVAGAAQVDQECLMSCTAMFNGFAYYNAPESSVVYLDTQLNQVRTISLEAHTTAPLIAPDGGEIFYCTGTQIRALDTQRNISRLVRESSSKVQRLLGVYFDGKVLACAVGETEDDTDTVYISTENGQTLCTENGISQLYTYENSYLALRQDGFVSQRIYGTRDGEAKLLHTPDAELIGALELNGVVGYTPTENGIALNFYDLASGRKTSCVGIPNITQVKDLVADRWSGCIWLLASGASCNGDNLLRWDLKTSPIQEDTVYFGTLFSQQQPDEEGLKNCQNRVNDLNKTYGVRIRIWQEAVKTPNKYRLSVEHQTTAINTVLDTLEPVLAEFPKNFLLKSISSRIRICVVRSVDGTFHPVQYWDGDDAFVILPVGSDIRSGFLKGLGFVIDSHILGNSAMLDYWNDLNPEGFTYGQADNKYLTKGSASFADTEAMASAVADRCSVFCNAMLPDNGELFQSETMQSKLLLLCQAIRDAWNLENKKDIYPWEQYLSQSIAPQ